MNDRSAPFKVLKRKLKNFVLDRHSTKNSAIIDKLNLAYLDVPKITPPPSILGDFHSAHTNNSLVAFVPIVKKPSSNTPNCG
nr:hypothetical protein HmN_000717400 [Hymenolepis microstoma]